MNQLDGTSGPEEGAPDEAPGVDLEWEIVPDEKDQVSKEERVFYKDPDKRLKHEEAEDRSSDRELRREYAAKVFKLVGVWGAATWVTIIFQGFRCIPFHLETVEFSIIVGGTSASIVGLLVAVISYLFPKTKGRRGHNRRDLNVTVHAEKDS